jgi:hypothetical protein
MRRILTALLLGTALAGLSETANAACSCGGVQNIVSRYSERTIQNVNAHTTEVGQMIAETILRGVAQLSAYEDRAVEANRRIEDAAQLNDTIRARQEARARAEGGRYDPAASACLDLSGLMNFGGGTATHGLGGVDVSNLSRNRSRGNGAEGQAVKQGGLAIAAAIKKDRDELRNIGGFADPTSDVRLLTEAVTLNTSEGQVAQAYARMINNMVDPIPAKPVTEGEANTPAGMAQIAARQIDATRRSASHAVFTHLGDLTAPTGGGELASWAKKAAPPTYPHEIGDQVSRLQAVDIFVESRFPNPEWHEAVAKMSPEAVQRENLLTNALHLYVDWMRFSLERRVATTQAATLAVELDDRDSRTTSIPVEN